MFYGGNMSTRKVRSTLGILKNKLFYERYSFFLEKNKKRLANLYDIHHGQRCFLLGTGPSINTVDLNLLCDEITIGQNMIYKKHFKTNYYFIAGYRILENHYDDICYLPTNMFYACSAGRWYLKNKIKDKPSDNNPYILPDFGEISVWNDISTDITKGVRGGSAIACISLQALYFMGFKEVILLGFDCNYTKPSGEYFYTNKTSTYTRDWNKVFNNYITINNYYEADGRKIYNATKDSTLDVFEKKTLEDIL